MRAFVAHAEVTGWNYLSDYCILPICRWHLFRDWPSKKQTLSLTGFCSLSRRLIALGTHLVIIIPVNIHDGGMELQLTFLIVQLLIANIFIVSWTTSYLYIYQNQCASKIFFLAMINILVCLAKRHLKIILFHFRRSLLSAHWLLILHHPQNKSCTVRRVACTCSWCGTEEQIVQRCWNATFRDQSYLRLSLLK